jgi:hypothetical protein
MRLGGASRGAVILTAPRSTDNTLVKALARAPRWNRMLESGVFAIVAELPEREGIALSYMTASCA